MKRVALATIVIGLWATNALAIMSGLVQPGVGVSLRHKSNNIGWQNEAGIGLYDQQNHLYGFMGTDTAMGIDWGLTSGSPAGSSYWTGQGRVDHIPITNPNFPTQCKGGPQYPYTLDNCTVGIAGLDLPYQTMYGSGGPSPFVTDSSIIYMAAYPLFVDGSLSALVTYPLGIAGGTLSNATPNPPAGTTLSFYNGQTQQLDYGTVVSTGVEVLYYVGPALIACDQYNDCQWTQPSAFTSNYGAPVTGSPFWTWPGGNGYGPMRDTATFINNNSQYLTAVMQVSMNDVFGVASEGGSMFTQNSSCRAYVGPILAHEYGAATQAVVAYASEVITLFDWGCDANGSQSCNFGNPPSHIWGIAGAGCSGNGLSPQYQVAEEPSTLGFEMPGLPKLPTLEETAKPNPRELSPALQAALNLELTHKPEIRRLNALVGLPAHVISPVKLVHDSDGVTRWHVGVVDLSHGFNAHMGVKASPAMTMSVVREFKSNGATAPVVVEPGYIAVR